MIDNKSQYKIPVYRFGDFYFRNLEEQNLRFLKQRKPQIGSEMTTSLSFIKISYNFGISKREEHTLFGFESNLKIILQKT